ncbi:hypothetical protein [Pedobacter sp. B4-66]|uniref:hypothetical protein n=1 Tax=Pedobacter sp. B4-66 TaxID=2817280 RepID=UPI001BDAE9BA|nr:hypothetical protein [Pedobacter sp. B4-66]
MKSINAFYSNLENSALYLQRKIWGRFFNELSGLRLVNASIGIIIILWLFIAINYLDVNLYMVFGFALLLVISLISFHFRKVHHRKSAAEKIEDFNTLTPIVRWSYLTYTGFIMVVAPILIFLAVGLPMFKS